MKRFARIAILLFCLAVGAVISQIVPMPPGWGGQWRTAPAERERRSELSVSSAGIPTLAPPRPSTADEPNGRRGVILVNLEVTAEAIGDMEPTNEDKPADEGDRAAPESPSAPGP